MPPTMSPDPLKSLLIELRDDDYVRFKYGKRVDAALKQLETQQALDARALESRLQEMLELVRGKKGGTPASPVAKSRKRPVAPETAAAGV